MQTGFFANERNGAKLPKKQTRLAIVLPQEMDLNARVKLSFEKEFPGCGDGSENNQYIGSCYWHRTEIGIFCLNPQDGETEFAESLGALSRERCRSPDPSNRAGAYGIHQAPQ
jgi:hypothetical protein